VYRHSLFSLLALLAGATLAHADILSFAVTVDTSSLTGGGYIDFQFNQAPSPPATPGTGTAKISGFLSSGGLSLGGEIAPIGNVTGSLAAPPIVIQNDPGANDYDELVNAWGSSFTFLVELDTAATDSGFFVSVLDSGFNPIVGPLPQGEVANLMIDDNGVITAEGSAYATAAQVPEPGALALLATVLVALAVVLRVRRSRTV